MSPRPWGCIPTRVLAGIWIQLGEAHGTWSGVIGTNQHSLWSPRRGQWSAIVMWSQKASTSPRLWGCILTQGFAVTLDATGRGPMGLVRCDQNQFSLAWWSPRRGLWSKSRGDEVGMTKWDLALGMDCDSTPSQGLSPWKVGRQYTHVMFQLEPLVPPPTLSHKQPQWDTALLNQMWGWWGPVSVQLKFYTK